ncbi:hypothetical protein PoB_000629600 [Plakobranchus ocellatus]|uniref:Uncharacterized protein n=1 Tax=Plakobranchus ocellatus TaxID=259542 RepID=A0AAV3XXV8_9GAST|nr:hypothetical protein PoB_000629600 [Plakobranchus ocellatus]
MLRFRAAIPILRRSSSSSGRAVGYQVRGPRFESQSGPRGGRGGGGGGQEEGEEEEENEKEIEDEENDVEKKERKEEENENQANPRSLHRCVFSPRKR